MARFNTKTVARRPVKTTNLAGGEAYTQDAKTELVSMLLTSMVQDQYYRTAEEGTARLRELLGKVDPLFAAKAAIFARNEFGMRSITHVAAAELAHAVKGEEWTKRFFDAVVARPDDMTETLSLYLSLYGKPVPNSLKKGFARAFGKFDGYQLAKYRGDKNSLSLVDVVNLVHPRATERNAEALAKLVAGTLKSTETWESKISAAGKSDDKEEAKADAWAELIRSKKIGYFALLRNLRNIAAQAPEVLTEACNLLVDEKLIKDSKVLPFRFLTAYQEVGNIDRRIKNALNKAIDIAFKNVPELPGKSLIVIDHSGSMHAPVGGSTKYGSRQTLGDLFAAGIFKQNDADVMVFGSDAKYVRGLDSGDTVMSLATRIREVDTGWNTNFHNIFKVAERAYDRVIIFTDMQGWVGYHTPDTSNYKRQYKADPFIYNFDLAGYGTMQFIGPRVVELAGFSEKVFDLMRTVETDRNAMVKRIEAVTF